MKAALTALSEFPGATRRLAVLGSMGELGQHAAELHREIGEFAAPAKPGVPHRSRPARRGLRERRDGSGLEPQPDCAALDAEEAAIALKPMLREADAVLVKGSHFMGLERLVAALTGKDSN